MTDKDRQSHGACKITRLKAEMRALWSPDPADSSSSLKTHLLNAKSVLTGVAQNLCLVDMTRNIVTPSKIDKTS